MTPRAPGQPLRVAVIGAAGKMGRLLVQAIEDAPDLTLAARIDIRGGGDPAGGGGLNSSLFAFAGSAIDLAVEFTRGDAPARIGPEIEKLGCAWLSGTTALTDASRGALQAAAQKVPVLWSPNMSLGVAVLGRLVEQAARLLPREWEMEIVETHHAAKLDAPSGTALALGEAWRSVRGGEFVHGRSGFPGPRPPAEIGVHAVRLPAGIGEHRLFLGAQAETLELAHRALDRGVFVNGALTALRWLGGKPAGLYAMRDWVEDLLGCPGA